jgi:hypothetical protein
MWISNIKNMDGRLNGKFNWLTNLIKRFDGKWMNYDGKKCG